MFKTKITAMYYGIYNRCRYKIYDSNSKNKKKKFEYTVIKTFQFMQTVIISFEGRL